MAIVAIVVICLALGALIGVVAAALAASAKTDYDPIKDEFEHKEVGPPPTNSNSWVDKS